jgi:hypothetical protein
MGISEPQPLAWMQPGDVIVPLALASVSAAQGQMAACPVFDILVDLTLDRLPPIGVCEIPEVARVGMSEEAAFEVLRVYVQHDNGHRPHPALGCNARPAGPADHPRRG